MSAISSSLQLIRSCSMRLPQHIVLFNNARSGPLKHYWTSLKVEADDLFDLGKSDSALLDPYLAPSWQWGFTSIHLAVFSSASPPPPHCANFLLRLPFTLLFSGYLNPSIPAFPSQKHICRHRALSSASPALTGGKRCAFQLCVCENNCPSDCSSPSSCPLSPLCIHVIHMHIWRVAEWAEKEMDGWRPAVCYRQEQIHNLWRENPALLGKSCKSSHLIFLIALDSLFQITHGDISRGPKSSK